MEKFSYWFKQAVATARLQQRSRKAFASFSERTIKQSLGKKRNINDEGHYREDLSDFGDTCLNVMCIVYKKLHRGRS